MNRPKESDFSSQAAYCRELEKYLYEVEANAATDRHIAELANDTSARLLKDAQRYQWLRKHVLMGYCSAEGCNEKDAYLTVTGYGDI